MLLKSSSGSAFCFRRPTVTTLTSSSKRKRLGEQRMRSSGDRYYTQHVMCSACITHVNFIWCTLSYVVHLHSQTFQKIYAHPPYTASHAHTNICTCKRIYICTCIHTHTATTLSVLLQMMAKFAEDDRLEQMNAQKRRMKQLEHRRAVERLIEERRQQFQMDKVSGIHLHTVLMCVQSICTRFL